MPDQDSELPPPLPPEPNYSAPYGTPPPAGHELPPVVVPPPHHDSKGMSEGQKKGLGGILLTIGAFFAKFGNVALVALKGAKLLPFVKTFGSMFITIWIYSLVYTWKFAVGFVIGIFIHEMGHVAVAAAVGVPVTAPVFIPFFGAMIIQKQGARSTWDEALIGIGGPLGGTIAGLIYMAIAVATGSDLFMALAYVTFLINLFNMTPVFPLDGGWITGAISPYIWLVGVILMAGMFVTGFVANPFILILIFMSLPRLWKGLRHGKFELRPGQIQTTKNQKITMGLAYVGLCLFLAFMTFESHNTAATARPSAPRGTAGQVQ